MSKAFFHSYTQHEILARCDEIGKSLANHRPSGITADVMSRVLCFTLAYQDQQGAWPDKEGNWTCVQTSLALKSLSRLGYTENSKWPIEGNELFRTGSISSALEFLGKEIESVEPSLLPSANIEDIWDVCQVVLALIAFNRKQVTDRVVAKITSDWAAIYRKELQNAADTWGGPAFISAMIEVVLNCNGDKDSTLPLMIEHLLKQEKTTEYNCYLWPGSVAEPCWHAALVLRQLCLLPESLYDTPNKRELVSRIVPALLKERINSDRNEHPNWGVHAEPRRRPMYTARVLEALNLALPYSDGSLSGEIDQAIQRGNQYLSSFKPSKPDFPPMESVKSTLAVAEYLSTIHVSIPSITAMQTSEILPSVASGIHFAQGPLASEQTIRSVEGGLRIAWLSDLHLANVNERAYGYEIRRIKIFRNLLAETKNYWSEPFAEKNLEYIAERLVEMRVQHIVITGDLTNLALPEQFNRARDNFVAVQAALWPDKPRGKLSAKLWTILPGNHDVNGDDIKNKLSLFSTAFAETYSIDRMETSCRFPFSKRIPSPLTDSKLSVELIGLDTTPAFPVHVIGMNAKGQLGDDQLERLKDLLPIGDDHCLRLIAMHHHPLVIPEIKAELFEYFMQLDPVEARKLINLCSAYSVHAILHGHFHTCSKWFAPRSGPSGLAGLMPILGAPCGTVGKPGVDVVFLELRECDIETINGLRRGMALYCQKYDATADQKWSEIALGVALYSET